MPSLNLRNVLRRNPDRPSLRERAATLKASAAKVMGKGQARHRWPRLAGGGEPSKAMSDLIIAHQLAYARCLHGMGEGGADMVALRAAEEEAFRALLHAPLTSDTDRGCYAAAVIERENGFMVRGYAGTRSDPLSVAYRNLRFGEHAREAACAEAPPARAVEAGAHPNATLLALAVPFFKAWARETASDYAMMAAFPAAQELHDAFVEACGAAENLARQIASIPATTPEGLGIKALAAIYCSADGCDLAKPKAKPEDNPVTWDSFVWEVHEGVKLLAADGADDAAPAAGDAAALALRSAIEREWAAQIVEERQEWNCAGAKADARVKARLDRQTALVEAAGALPSGTKEAQHAKALALAWSYSPDVWRPTLSREQHGTDGRLVVDLMQGLTGAVPAAHAPQPAGAAPPVLDLSGCSIRELARLYEALHATWDHLSALGQLPCFWNGDEPAFRRSFNPAGKIIDREADRLAGLSSACAEEIARRAPQSENDADEALTTRLLHELVCNGRIHDPALMREIATAWGA